MDRLLSMRTFAEVVDQGGFAAAARSLALSPAVVTRLVGDLEAHLGTRLLQRTTRRIALTEAGEAYLARLRPILSDLEDATQLAQAETREMRGVIRIVSSPTLALHILAPLVAEFRIEHPGISLDIQVETTAQAFIEDCDLTLFVTYDAFDGDVIARRLVESESLLYAAPRYLRRIGAPSAPADLAHHPVLKPKLRGNLTGSVWQLLSSRGDEPITVATDTAMVSNYPEILLRAALDGAGIAALPVLLAAPYLTSGALERVLPDWTAGHAVVYVALPSRKFLPARTRALLDFLLKHTRRQIEQLESHHGRAVVADSAAETSAQPQKPPPRGRAQRKSSPDRALLNASKPGRAVSRQQSVARKKGKPDRLD